MKITFVGGFGFRPKGTIQGRAFPIAAELVGQGHDVTILVTPYDNLKESDKEWVEEGVRIKGLKVGSSSLSYPAVLLRLFHAVDQCKPDVVHIFKPKGFAAAAATYLRMKGMRNIVLDCDDLEGWGGWNDILSYPWVIKEYIDRQERWMMRSIPAVTVASRSLLDRVYEVRKQPAGVYYVPNCGTSPGGLKAHHEARARSQEEVRKELGLPEGLIIFYNGHFEPGDDIMLFCRTATPVAQRNNASIVFVGDGPDLPKVRDFYAAHPNVKVLFFPRLPYSQFVSMIWASDVTAFPYPDNPVHRSKCSLRVIDYMAMGKPVITSAVGQNKEYIVDGESGILAAAEDEVGFAQKLEMLLRSPELRDSLGRGAEKRIREHFSWGGTPLQQCLAAYSQVVRH
jgi:glycosyltransferase involved in cell wall biosynthesis